MDNDCMKINIDDCNDLLILKCRNNKRIDDIHAMQKELCEMKKSGIILLPNDVYAVAIPKNLQYNY